MALEGLSFVYFIKRYGIFSFAILGKDGGYVFCGNPTVCVIFNNMRVTYA